MVGKNRRVRRHGFTLVELTIVILILAILAALVIPRYSGAADTANGNAIRENLRYIRMQIQVYAAQHKGTPPGYPPGAPLTEPTEPYFVEQMTNITDDIGNIGSTFSQTFRFGPYLSEIPVNNINGSSAIKILGSAENFPAEPDDPSSFGWIYKADTMEFRAFVAGADESGVNFYDY